MKIAILGAPGSGKTEVAKHLTELLDVATTISDGYADEFSRHTGLAVGHAADFTVNMQIAFERLRSEQYADQMRKPLDGTHHITCGTLIESILYTRMYAEGRLKHASREDWHVEIARAQTTAILYGQLVWDTWRYDHVFVNPYREDQRDDSWNSILDHDLMAGLESFFVKYAVLPNTLSSKDRAEFAYKSIRRHEATSAD